jgi:hypothetical protein
MIFAASLPRFKDFLAGCRLKGADLANALLFLTAFLLPAARRSVTAAAHAVLSDYRHAGWLLRWLGGSRAPAALLAAAQGRLVAAARPGGLHLILLDSTLHGQQGRHAQNTFACGNSRPRPKQSGRHQRRVHRRSGHCFVFALLLTPCGLRVPYWLPYYTREFCALFGRRHHSQASLAAQLLDAVALPAGGRAVVVGDTAFEARQVRAACARRGFSWVVPLNPERRLAGRKGQRAPVRSLYARLSAGDFGKVSFRLDQGDGALQARVSPKRCQPGTHTRTYWVHHRTATVHNVGAVALLFSTAIDPTTPAGVTVQKVLISDRVAASTAELLAWYALRWQVELFFKECKGGLGLCQYKLGLFARVAGWVNLGLVAFCYLEWYRRHRQAQAPGADQPFWRSARTAGLAEQVRRQVLRADLEAVLRLAGTAAGREQLRALLDRIGNGPAEVAA